MRHQGLPKHVRWPSPFLVALSAAAAAYLTGHVLLALWRAL